MATQQFGYGPNVWAPAKGVGAVAIPKLLQPGAVTPEFKPENPYKALAAKAIGEMAYASIMGGLDKEEPADKEKPNWLSTEKHYQQTAGQIFEPSLADMPKNYTIIYKEVGPLRKQKPIGIEGDYSWDTDREGFLNNKNLDTQLPEIFKLLPIPDEKGTWVWKGDPPKWKYQPPTQKGVNDGGKDYGVKEHKVPDLAANGWWEETMDAGEGMQYSQMGDRIRRVPVSDLTYGKRTLLEAGEINKDADLSIYGWKPGAIEPDEEGSLKQDLITTGQADLDKANAIRLQDEQTRQRNILHRAESLSPVTQEILETAAEDLDAAGDDQAARESVFENAKEGLMDFAEMNPQLAKSILSAIAAMVMGESFGDAIATGFGVHEEAAMREEAASDTEAGEIVAMMIANAEWLTDDNFEAILAQYPNLSDDAKKSIYMKWEIAKNTADKVKGAKDLAELLKDIDDFSTGMSTKYSTTDNVTIVGPAITDFLTYANKQLLERKEPTSIIASAQKPSIERAIGVYAGRVDRAIENEYSDELAVLRSGGIEAIWEGMHGSFRFVDGVPHSNIVVPESQEGNYGISLMILDEQFKGNETRISTYLAKKREEWEKNIMGKKYVKFNETDEDVAKLEAEGKRKTAADSGYFSWLIAKLYAERANAE